MNTFIAEYDNVNIKCTHTLANGFNCLVNRKNKYTREKPSCFADNSAPFTAFEAVFIENAFLFGERGGMGIYHTVDIQHNTYKYPTSCCFVV